MELSNTARLHRAKSDTLFKVLSSVWWIPTHWVGRTIPCPGVHCPACDVHRTKQRGYILCLAKPASKPDSDPELCVVEIMDPRHLNSEPPGVGSILAGDRHRAIKVLQRSDDPLDPAAEAALARSLEALFRLPTAVGDDTEIATPTAWVAAHWRALHHALSGHGGDPWHN